MALALYLIFIGAACALSLVDWRRGWLLVMICGVIQDPVRKLTPGSPVYISFLVVILYAVLLFGARNDMRQHAADFTRRFRSVSTGIAVFIVLLLIAGLNGLVTYGFDKWQAPMISFVTYVIPMVAALLGYTWLHSEETMLRFFRTYAMITAVALFGTFFEYMRVQSRLLGLVSFEGDYIRHLPGIQIRMLSGIYRSPDVMAWHAGMLTCIGLALAVRAGMRKQMMIWAAVAGWGFFNCLIGGRRKAVYFVIVFCLAFFLRYLRRVQPSQLFACLGLLAILGVIVNQLSSDESTSMYTRTAIASRGEIGQRLEGGLMQTFREVGLMGAGLGTATQGVHHLLGVNAIGWQEGGLGKVAIEIGLPGLVALALMGIIVMRLMVILTGIPDVEGSSQFLRVMLFSLVMANIAGFMGSAQAYNDAVLALTAGFLVGALFASAALDERLPAKQEVQPKLQLSPQPSAL
ncbi:MAG TPA: hypothetical protein VGQ76_01785 [Thermoanaerobaculia bacterium]|jgi:hypothetical protein|nr:hypothetical protein [Thermoanaerobaculia bacterium]